ncbi:biotin/lipoyl-containing protein [Paenibacillus sp. GCM10027626]|uniref:biotin/lipoyl-containing protein n=1 Tax=Paenibacillus sp. GCM10027626 TaxID=3273411 RepID=UPI0036351C53
MYKVVIPKMGMSTVEVDLTRWHVKVGDKVKVGDELAEVESEKANFTIEAEVDGTVFEIIVGLNETVDVGTVICLIAADV